MASPGPEPGAPATAPATVPDTRRPAVRGLKAHLPHKPCQHCQRPMAWRKAWARCWDEVRYCSERCKREARRA